MANNRQHVADRKMGTKPEKAGKAGKRESREKGSWANCAVWGPELNKIM